MSPSSFSRSACALLSTISIAACSSSSSPPKDAGRDGETDASDAALDTGADTSAERDDAGSYPCSPDASVCTTADPLCVALTSNSGLTKFGLRMSSITIANPAVLTTGAIAQTITLDMIPNAPGCYLSGGGSFSWLLQFDTLAGTVKTGGATPPANPSQGYAFADQMITQGSNTFHVQPTTYTQPSSPGGTFGPTPAADVIIPMFLDPAGSEVILFPLRSLSLQGTLSPNDDCIGTFDAQGISQNTGCQPSSTAPLFNNGGGATAFINLNDADQVVVGGGLSESLCVLLSGNGQLYGMAGPNNVAVCTRDTNGNILFQGDWCTATNSAASTTCADAVQFSFQYAAAGVTITN